jgi:hypothetical protein
MNERLKWFVSAVLVVITSSASPRASIKLVNRADGPVELFWDGGGAEHPMGVIEVAQQLPLDTFVGHTFVVKTKAGKKLSFKVEDVATKFFEITTDGVKPIKAPPPAKKKKRQGNLLARFLGSHSVKFRNLETFPVHVYFDDHKGGVLQNIIHPGKEIGMNSYIGHSFFFTPTNDKTKKLKEITVNTDEVMYVYEPKAGTPSHVAFLKDKKKQAFIKAERAYMDAYKKETGVYWRAVYPR